MDFMDIWGVVEIELLKRVSSRQDGNSTKRKHIIPCCGSDVLSHYIHKVEKELFLFL